jgi:hypothetical protein
VDFNGFAARRIVASLQRGIDSPCDSLGLAGALKLIPMIHIFLQDVVSTPIGAH